MIEVLSLSTEKISSSRSAMVSIQVNISLELFEVRATKENETPQVHVGDLVFSQENVSKGDILTIEITTSKFTKGDGNYLVCFYGKTSGGYINFGYLDFGDMKFGQFWTGGYQ